MRVCISLYTIVVNLRNTTHNVSDNLLCACCQPEIIIVQLLSIEWKEIPCHVVSSL